MNFTVKYRTSSGALATEIADGSSRSVVLSEYRQRGVSVISVIEGGESPRKQTERKWPRFIIGALLCAVLGVIVWLYLSSPDRNKGPTTNKKHTDAAVHPGRTNMHDNTSVCGQMKTAEPTLKKRAIGLDHTQIRTNASQVTVENSNSNGLNAVETNSVAVPKPVFTNVSDQLLAMVATTVSGDAPPIPFSEDIEKQFLASLNTPIEILATDDEKVKELKQAVMDMRAEVKQMMDKGQTLRQILSEHQKLARQNSEIRRSALMELKGIIASGDISGAVEYKRKINAALGQMGIAELKIPVTDEDHEEIARAKEQRKLERSMKKEQEQK